METDRDNKRMRSTPARGQVLERFKFFCSLLATAKSAYSRPAASEMQNCLYRRPCLATFRYATSGTQKLKML
jgi:hypothetical protein